MTVYGLPLSEMVLPMMSGSLSNGASRPVAEHDHPVAVGAILFGAEGAALEDWRAKQLEEIGRHTARAELLGKRAAGVVDDAGVEGRGVTNHLRLLAVVHELRRRAPAVDALRRRRLKHHEAVGVGKRHRLQQHRVDHREDGGVRADAERQRRNGGGGEAAALPEHPERLAQVLEEAFNHGGPRNYVSGRVRPRQLTDEPNARAVWMRSGEQRL